MPSLLESTSLVQLAILAVVTHSGNKQRMATTQNTLSYSLPSAS